MIIRIPFGFQKSNTAYSKTRTITFIRKLFSTQNSLCKLIFPRENRIKTVSDTHGLSQLTCHVLFFKESCEDVGQPTTKRGICVGGKGIHMGVTKESPRLTPRHQAQKASRVGSRGTENNQTNGSIDYLASLGFWGKKLNMPQAKLISHMQLKIKKNAFKAYQKTRITSIFKTL